jgi:3-phenylpropionate/cinnamic acid dioxygenase small subunit
MTVQDERPVVAEDQLAAMLVHYEVEKFLLDEAALLDAHSYKEWVELFTDDVHYFMPLRRTMSRRELAKEFTQPGEMAFFDDDKPTLQARVVKFDSGTAWAEDPPSRTRHLITNIRVLEDDGTELSVESYFHLYRTRLKSEEDNWVGRRLDTLRRTEAGLKVAKRLIYLDQTLLLSRNLSNFF